MTYTFDIYFSDLNDDAKTRLLEFVGVKSASDMNWDIDILPIACFDLEKSDEEEGANENLCCQNG